MKSSSSASQRNYRLVSVTIFQSGLLQAVSVIWNKAELFHTY